MSYTVQSGDSWAKIAGIVYGDQRQFQNLMAANSGISVLHPGMVINTPSFQPSPVVTVDPTTLNVGELMGVNPFSQQGNYLLTQSGAAGGPAASLAALAAPSAAQWSPGSWAQQESAGIGPKPWNQKEEKPASTATTQLSPGAWAQQESASYRVPPPRTNAPGGAQNFAPGGAVSLRPPFVSGGTRTTRGPGGPLTWETTMAPGSPEEQAWLAGLSPAPTLGQAVHQIGTAITSWLRSQLPAAAPPSSHGMLGGPYAYAPPSTTGKVAGATGGEKATATTDRDQQAMQLYAFNAEHQDQVFARFQSYVTPGNPLYGNTAAIPNVVGSHVAEQLIEWWRRLHGVDIERRPPDMRGGGTESWSDWDIMTNMFGYSYDPTAIDPVTGRATGAWLRDAFSRPSYTPYAFGAGGYTTGYGGGGGGGGGGYSYSSKTNAVLHNWNIRIT